MLFLLRSRDFLRKHFTLKYLLYTLKLILTVVCVDESNASSLMKLDLNTIAIITM